MAKGERLLLGGEETHKQQADRERPLAKQRGMLKGLEKIPAFSHELKDLLLQI